MATKNKLNANEITFTQQQIKIMQLWGELPNETAIASSLGLSKHTIHTHLRRMRKKLDVQRTFDIWKHLKNKGLL